MNPSRPRTATPTATAPAPRTAPRTTAAVRTLVRAVVVTLLAALGVAAQAVGPAAWAADGASWTVRTVDNHFGSGRPNYSYALAPGGRLDDGLTVTNPGTTPLDLSVYAADAFTTEQGALDLLTGDAKSKGVGTWVHAGKDRLTVAPGRSAEVPFSLTVPAGTRPGDYMGGIVTSLTQDGVERRVGIRIRLRVGGALKPTLAVENLSVDYTGTANPLGMGEATVSYTVRNTGNAVLAARQTVSVSGPFSLAQVKSAKTADTPQLLPGESWKVTAPLHGVTPAVSLTARVALEPLLPDAAGSIAPLAAQETTGHGWAVPWTLLAIVVVVLCALALTVRTLRRRHRGGVAVPAV